MPAAEPTIVATSTGFSSRHRGPWDAQPGPASLCTRATDSAGNQQPLVPEWNFGGYGNNAVQRVSVIVV